MTTKKYLSEVDKKKLLTYLNSETGNKKKLAIFMRRSQARISYWISTGNFPANTRLFLEEIERKERTKNLLNKLLNMIDEMKKHIEEFLKSF